MAILILLYLCACGVCGYMGRNTRAGAIGHFFLALLITPIGDFVFQWANRPAPHETGPRDRR
jgi:hypothetical protein